MEFNQIQFENENGIHIYKVEGKCELHCIKKISDEVVLSIKFNDNSMNPNFHLFEDIQNKLIITVNNLNFECRDIAKRLNDDLNSIKTLYATLI